MLEKYNKNRNPFSVPENYFEGLTEDIMNNLPNKVEETKKVSLWKKVLPWSAVAAAVVAAVLAVNLVVNNMPDTNLAQNTDEGINSSSHKNIENEEEDYFKFLEEESVEAMYVSLLFED